MDWAYRFPEKVLARRKFTKAEVKAAADAPVSEGDETFHDGFCGRRDGRFGVQRSILRTRNFIDRFCYNRRNILL